MTFENNRLEKTRTATEKQWEESLTAMSGRDKAIQSMSDRAQIVSTKLSEADLVNKISKTEQTEAANRMSKKELGLRRD